MTTIINRWTTNIRSSLPLLHCTKKSGNYCTIHYPSLKLHGCRHIGHSCRIFCWDSSHFIMHCLCSQSKKYQTATDSKNRIYMCIAWPQVPHTGGQSSPGYLTPGQHASYGIRQIPQTLKCKTWQYFPLFEKQKWTSSSAISHFQIATPCHLFTRTFILCVKQKWRGKFYCRKFIWINPV